MLIAILNLKPRQGLAGGFHSLQGGTHDQD
jgi:hypothetical protein